MIKKSHLNSKKSEKQIKTVKQNKMISVSSHWGILYARQFKYMRSEDKMWKTTHTLRIFEQDFFMYQWINKKRQNKQNIRAFH